LPCRKQVIVAALLARAGVMVPDENAAVAAALGLARDAESATQWPQAVDAALTWLRAAAADALEVRYCST